LRSYFTQIAIKKESNKSPAFKKATNFERAASDLSRSCIETIPKMKPNV
jgi:hypothetical protein